MKGDRLVVLILGMVTGAFAGLTISLRQTVQGLIEDMDRLTRQVDEILKYLERSKKERADDGK